MALFISLILSYVPALTIKAKEGTALSIWARVAGGLLDTSSEALIATICYMNTEPCAMDNVEKSCGKIGGRVGGGEGWRGSRQMDDLPAPALCELHVNYFQQPKLSNILLEYLGKSFLCYIHSSEI